MKFKKNTIVIFNGLAMATFPYIEKAYQEEGHSEPTLTSGIDGTHGGESLHYQGKAWDFAIPYPLNNPPAGQKNALHLKAVSLCERLWQALNNTTIAYDERWDLGDKKQYDVVLENDHIHVEYDPA